MKEPVWKQRLRESVEADGRGMKAISLAAGQGETFVRDILERDRIPSIEKFLALARALGASPAHLAGESEPAMHRVGVKGLVSAGGVIDTGAEQIPEDGNLYEIEVPFPLLYGAFALQVSGESMVPRYDSGDVIICNRYSIDPSQLIDAEAAVQTLDGNRYLKRILQTSRKGIYDLESFNARIIRGVRLKWASSIQGVVRAGQWRKLKATERQKLSRTTP